MHDVDTCMALGVHVQASEQLGQELKKSRGGVVGQCTWQGGKGGQGWRQGAGKEGRELKGAEGRKARGQGIEGGRGQERRTGN